MSEEPHEKIYLQWHGGDNQATWCEDQIHDDDVEYVVFSTYSALQSRAETAEEKLKRVKENVIIFAAQLQAWGYKVAADEVVSEILGGKVNAPDYYAMKQRAETAEARATELQQAADERDIMFYELQANHYSLELDGDQSHIECDGCGFPLGEGHADDCCYYGEHPSHPTCLSAPEHSDDGKKEGEG